MFVASGLYQLSPAVHYVHNVGRQPRPQPQLSWQLTRQRTQACSCEQFPRRPESEFWPPVSQNSQAFLRRFCEMSIYLKTYHLNVFLFGSDLWTLVTFLCLLPKGRKTYSIWYRLLHLSVCMYIHVCTSICTSFFSLFWSSALKVVVGFQPYR